MQKLDNSIAGGNLEFPLTFEQNQPQEAPSFESLITGREYFVLKSIHDAPRIAKAFQNYMFLLTSFSDVAGDFYSETKENYGINKRSISAKRSGLEALLQKTEAQNGEAGDVEKMKFLLRIYIEILTDINELTPEEQKELEVANKLLEVENPLADDKMTWSELAFSIIGTGFELFLQSRQDS